MARVRRRTTHFEEGPDLTSDEVRHADEKLSSWESGEYYGRYWSHPRTLDEWFGTPAETIQKLTDIVSTDIREIVESGLLQALPPAPLGDTD